MPWDGAWIPSSEFGMVHDIIAENILVYDMMAWNIPACDVTSQNIPVYAWDGI